ncbi:30S ribosomal protein S21 [Spirochaetota bacterium]|nr:30S ribosomal protein S21 [Spirochaetota bacterium]
MAVVYIRESENIEGSIRRFKKEVDKERIIKELKERRFYKKPALVKKIEATRLEKRIRRNKRFTRYIINRRPTY